MAEPQPTLAELKERLHQSRAHLLHSAQDLESRLNVKQRVVADVTANPLKYVALAAGAGFVAIKLLPSALRLFRKPLTASLLSPLAKSAATAALPLVADAFLKHFQKGPSAGTRQV